MGSPSHRDRVLAVINHEVPDRHPVDFGGSPASGINLYAYKRLKEHLVTHPAVMWDVTSYLS